MMIEPLVQGATSMRMHSPGFVAGVRRLTREADVFLVADEVFTALDRTGTRFACDAARIVPDVLCLAKSLSGGILPFAATLATERVYGGFLGGRERALHYGHSYCGNPLGAAVAREVLAVHRDEDIAGHVARKAPRIRAAFEAIASRVPGGAPWRARGMVGAVDLGSGGYLGGAGWRAFEAARERGVYLRPLGDTVYIAPALNIPDDVLEELLGVVVVSVRAAVGGTGGASP
jgi:adenosylmethionine-8-amino-7-oxononanoate aminotransferase